MTKVSVRLGVTPEVAMPGFSYDLPPVGASAEERDPADPAAEREAYIARWGGHWGDSVSSGGVWIKVTAPVPGPDREERGRGGD